MEAKNCHVSKAVNFLTENLINSIIVEKINKYKIMIFEKL